MRQGSSISRRHGERPQQKSNQAQGQVSIEAGNATGIINFEAPRRETEAEIKLRARSV